MSKKNIFKCVLLLSFLWVGNVSSQNRKVIVEARIIGEQEQELPAFYDELNRRGFNALVSESESIEKHHSLPGHELKSAENAEIEKNIGHGISLYLEGKFKKAREVLSVSLDQKMKKPAIVARNQTLRDSTYQALVYLAMCSNRLSDSVGVRRSVEEFIRSFPDREVSSRQFGPEASSLFRKVSSVYTKNTKGVLKITLDNPSAVVFINERYVGVGEQELALYPGSYRVYTQRGSLAGRVYNVSVSSNQTSTLVSSAVKDKAIATGAEFFLSFDSEEELEKNSLRFALEIASSLNSKELVVVHIKKQELLGVHIGVNEGAILNKVSIGKALAVTPTEQRQFAKKTISGNGTVGQVGETLGQPIENKDVPKSALQEEIFSGGLKDIKAPTDNSTSGISSAWRYSSWGLGLVGIAGGAYLLKIDGDLTEDGMDRFKTKTPGFALLGGSAALIIAGFIFWDFESNDSKLSVDYDASNDKYGFVFSGQF